MSEAKNNDMKVPISISIIGAGPSALILSRTLLSRGIPSTLYEKSSKATFSKRNNYGITLHRHAYQPLLPILGLDEAGFRRMVGVDAGIGGNGSWGDGVGGKGREGSGLDGDVRVNRNLFERLLVEGLDVRWESDVSSLETKGDGNGEGSWVKLKGGEEVQSQVIVGADGVHSIVREAVAPGTELEVLPFVAVHGKRRIPSREFEEAFGVDGGNVFEQRVGDALFQVSVSSKTDKEVGISYTYSRPMRTDGVEDALFRPKREKSEAKEIPGEFSGEVEKARSGLESGMRMVFDAERMKGDRLLNWLMRCVEVDERKLLEGAQKGVVLVGDAVHAEPILGGEGANVGIEDGMRLAALLAESGVSSISQLYQERLDVWKRSVKESKARISAMHGVAKPSL